MTNAVTESELLATMVEGYRYRRSDLVELFCEAPAPAVHDALEGLVRKGQVWKPYAGGRYEYVRLSPADLADMAQRRADRSEAPPWMNATLRGYESALFMRASLIEPTSYRR